MRKPGEKNPDELMVIRKRKREGGGRKEEIDRKEEETLRKAEEAFWRKGFDIEIEGAPCYFGGMSVYNGGVDCPLVARLYPKVGLHRYNMLGGTNLHLREIEKYNLVWIKSEIYPKQFFDAVDLPGKWPSKEAFADKTRFLYKMQESYWEEHDWIRLYMEIAFFNRDRWLNHNLSDLKILNVVVETEENLPYETVLESFRNVLVYIRYDQDLGADGVCKHIAIVRRTVEPTTHCVCLFGESLLVPDSE
ncbi:unnamed protein product [Brassica oleracea var. botrytis]